MTITLNLKDAILIQNLEYKLKLDKMKAIARYGDYKFDNKKKQKEVKPEDIVIMLHYAEKGLPCYQIAKKMNHKFCDETIRRYLLPFRKSAHKMDEQLVNEYLNNFIRPVV